MGLWGAQPLSHLLHFVLFLLLEVDVEGGPVLTPLFSKEPGDCSSWAPNVPVSCMSLIQIGDSSFGAPSASVAAAPAPARLGAPISSGLSDLFDLTSGVGALSGSYVAPKAVSPSCTLLAGAEKRNWIGIAKASTELSPERMGQRGAVLCPSLHSS